jgi:hypothetical protein
MQYTDYMAFNPTNAQLTTNNHLSLYSVPPTCFSLSMTIIRRSPTKEYNNGRFDVHIWSQNTMFSIKTVKIFKI